MLAKQLSNKIQGLLGYLETKLLTPFNNLLIER